MIDQLNEIFQAAIQQIQKAGNLESLFNIQTKVLGRKGELTGILRQISQLLPQEKASVGRKANELKIKLQEAINQKRNDIKREDFSKIAEQESIDVTYPSEKRVGNLHPVAQVQAEIEDLFTSMGFMVLDGPEVESDYYNFEALNFSADHPARDTQDTFYLEGNNLMRTQTSNVQVRAMEKYGAPLRAIVPGRCFRNESLDACHENTFSQIEGLMVDTDISVANLIGVMKDLVEKVLKRKVVTRLRPGFFPFVEPGFEMDIRCLICNGQGCPSCKNSGWLEILPCGMVHPNVLKSSNVDPKKYSGFAFGLGLDRLTMMKYNIDNIRLVHSGDLRFLNQF